MILMNIDGVDGISEVPDHEKWIICDTVKWAIDRKIVTEPGRTKDRTPDAAHAKPVTITKKMDSSGARLFEVAAGAEGKKVVIHFLSGAGKELSTYAEWTLENALVDNYAVDTTADGEQVETLSLDFEKIEIKSFEKTADDKVGSPYPVAFSQKSGALE